MTHREITKLIVGPNAPYRYGNVLPNGEVVTVGHQLALRRELSSYPPAGQSTPLPPAPPLLPTP